MDELTGMVFHSAEREVERLEQQRDEARQEAAELRRQVAEERMRANAAEFAVAQLRAEAADLRRQVDRAGYEYRDVQRALVEVGEATGADNPTSPESILDALADLRRQVEHANRWRDNEILAANEARAEAADLRRQLDAVPRDAIADLYDAYAYAVAGWPEGKAQEFPQVARWLGILPADDSPPVADDELLPPNRQTVADVRIVARQRPDILIADDDFATDTPRRAGEGDA